MVALIVLFYFHRFPLIRSVNRSGWFLSIAVLAALIYLNPVTQRFYSVAYSTYGMSGENKLVREDFQKSYSTQTAPKFNGKNLVVLYLESFERTFLDENIFPGLAPNLNALQHDADNFTSISDLNATGWTMGGIVASQCGIPLVTPINSDNDMNQVGAFLPEAICLGDYLKAAGYRLEFYGGAPKQFAGKDKFFLTHSFDAMNGLDELAQEGELHSEWGRYDSSTLEDLLKRYRMLTSENKPFGLVGLTLDTHAPTGYIPPTCKNSSYGDGTDSYLNAIHCSDEIVGAFIKKLRLEPGFDNTVFIVASDHRTMKNVSAYSFEGKRNNLLLAFNGKTGEPREYKNPGTSLDTGATILDYLTDGSSKSLALGRTLRDDNISTLLAALGSTQLVEDKLVSWRPALMQFWDFPTNFGRGVRESKNGNAIRLAETRIDLPLSIVTASNSITEYYLRDAITQFGNSVSENKEAVFFENCKVFLNIGSVNTTPANACYVSYSPTRGFLFGKLSKDRLSYSEIFDNSMGQHLNKEAAQKILFIAKEQTSPEFYHIADTLQQIEKPMRLLSTGFTTAAAMKPTDIALRRGFNIVSVDSTGSTKLIGTLDFCAANSIPEGSSFSTVQKEFSDKYPGSTMALIVYDTAFCGNRATMNAFFEGSNLNQIEKIAFRGPYIALLGDNSVSEFVGVPNLPLIVTNVKKEEKSFAMIGH